MIAADRLLTALDAVLLAEARDRRDTALAPVRRRLERRVVRVLALQEAALLRRLAHYAPIFPTPLVESLSAADLEPMLSGVFAATRVLFERAIRAASSVALRLGGRATLADLGVETSFSLDNPRAVAFLRAHGADRVTLIDEATRDELRALLVDAAGRGWSYGRTAKEIRTRFAGMRRDRAALIATTEVGEAYQAGNLLAAQDVAAGGTAMEKSWLAVLDQRTSDLCRGNAAAGWIALDDAFPSGHDRPLGHPRCRCALVTRPAG